jgi:MFS family permease
MSANSISSRRLKNLIRYEWALDKRFYLLGTLGVFMIAFGGFLSIWFSQYSGFTWRSVDYNSIFFSGFVFLSVFGISQSFVELRAKNTSVRYLTLPAGIMEKFLVQVIFRLIIPLIIYPIVFWLGANLSVDVYYIIQQTIFENTAFPEINMVEVLYLYWIPNANIDIGYWILFGLIISIPSLMFMGGIIFRKWSFIVMPAIVAGFILLMFGSFFGLSFLLDASPYGAGGDYSIRVDDPEVFDGVPLFILVCLILTWVAVFLHFVVTYFKLKEREV